jgi:hypothetical protein
MDIFNKGIYMVKLIKKASQKVRDALIELGQPENFMDIVEPNTDIIPGEFLTQKGAMLLAKRLQNYWHEKGYIAARFWAEPIGERFEKVGTYEIYRVTSNLVNGFPPRYAASYQPPTQSMTTH